MNSLSTDTEIFMSRHIKDRERRYKGPTLLNEILETRYFHIFGRVFLCLIALADYGLIMCFVYNYVYKTIYSRYTGIFCGLCLGFAFLFLFYGSLRVYNKK